LILLLLCPAACDSKDDLVGDADEMSDADEMPDADTGERSMDARCYGCVSGSGTLGCGGSDCGTFYEDSPGVYSSPNLDFCEPDDETSESCTTLEEHNAEVVACITDHLLAGSAFKVTSADIQDFTSTSEERIHVLADGRVYSQFDSSNDLSWSWSAVTISEVDLDAAMTCLETTRPEWALNCLFEGESDYVTCAPGGEDGY
jgi:hypothetical protein